MLAVAKLNPKGNEEKKLIPYLNRAIKMNDSIAAKWAKLISRKEDKRGNPGTIVQLIATIIEAKKEEMKLADSIGRCKTT